MTAPARTPAPRAVPDDGVAVRARGLTKTYGTGPTAVHALDHVDVDFRARRFTAIMGPSGSGKSTLLQCAAGLDTATSGRCRIGPTELTGLTDRELTVLRREQVGFVFQSFNLLPTLTARENILLPLRLAGRRPDRAWFEHVVGALGLGDRLTHRPDELSGGQQQRVAVARALVPRPRVVFADEPTGALDSATGADLLGFLRHSVDELGQTVVMVTHDPVAAGYADRIVRLADGRIAADSDDEATPAPAPAADVAAPAMSPVAPAAASSAAPAAVSPAAFPAAPAAVSPAASPAAVSPAAPAAVSCDVDGR